MSTPNDGGPAFPEVFSDQPSDRNGNAFPDVYSAGGMTLRDWFAGQALAAMTVAPDYSKGPCNSAMVERAYLIADMMLTAKARGGADQSP